MSRRIVDSHIHWRDPRINPYEAISDKAPSEDGERGGAEAEVYTPEDYFRDAEIVELAGLIHIEAEWSKADPVGETRWLEDLTAEGRTRGLPFAAVGFADLAAPDVEPVLEAHAMSPLMRGIRQMLNFLPGRPEFCWSDRNYLDDPVWCRGFALLKRYGLDFDLMCFAHQMPAMANLAAKHPGIRVHLEHTGMPWDHSDAGRAAWRDGLRTLARLDQVDLKISGLGNTIEHWTTDKIRPYVLEAIEIFGTERACFASNFPTDSQFSDMAAIWRAFFEITNDFSADEKEALFVTNALKAYRLEQAERPWSPFQIHTQ